MDILDGFAAISIGIGSAMGIMGGMLAIRRFVTWYREMVMDACLQRWGFPPTRSRPRWPILHAIIWWHGGVLFTAIIARHPELRQMIEMGSDE